MKELFEEIESFTRLCPNWDGDSADPVSEETAGRAKALLAFLRANIPADRWREPSASPSPDGGVCLSWDDGERWLMIDVEAREKYLACVTQDGHHEPAHQWINDDDALVRLFWALCTSASAPTPIPMTADDLALLFRDEQGSTQ